MDGLRCLASAPVLLAGLLASAAAPAPARAAGEMLTCTEVTALPITITNPGHYCLVQDFDYTGFGAAIYIQADNVVFDCNHHRVANTGAPGEYTGIVATNELEGVVIRNCTIDNFGGGIFVQSTSEPGASANLVEGNTLLRSGAYGINVYGSNNRIERNRISGNTGAVYGQASGIEVAGYGSSGTANAIRDNVISDFKPAKHPDFNFTVMGISFSNVNNTEVTGNTVVGLYAPTDRHVHGIVSQGTNGSIVARNTVLAPKPLPAPYDGGQTYGIVLFTPAGNNACRDNVVGHFVSNLGGCVDSVNTDF